MSQTRLIPTSANSANGGNDNELFKKKASFIQHSLPGLASGTYQIVVNQSLTQNGSDITGGGLPSLTRRFGVAGPRFSLPQNAIHSVFPPSNSTGEFSTSLAHVVLETDTLPWQRSPYLPPVPTPETLSYQADGTTIKYDQDQATWLAVLLLSPSDFGGQDPSQRFTQGAVPDLVPQSLTVGDATTSVAGTLPTNGYSLFSYFLEVQNASPIDPGVGQTIQDAMQYIDLPCPLFDAIAPSLADLQMMAHVRAVEMDAKPLTPGQPVDPVQQYGLALGNRLPESLFPGSSASPPLGTNVALLVSLESLESALRGHATNSDYATGVDTLSNGFVRLPVLTSWRFTSLPDTSFDFVTQLESLNGCTPGSQTPEQIPNPQLRLPNPPTFTNPTTEQSVAQDMLASGYLPFNHLTRVALPGVSPQTPNAQIQTFSWRRGPLIPMGAFTPDLSALFGPGTSVFSSDALLRFDPNIGMYDVSYAAAWQLGRMVALQNQDFAATQYRWKQQAAVDYRVTVERAALTARSGSFLDRPNGDERAGKTLRRNLLHRLAGAPVPQPATTALEAAPSDAPQDFPPFLPAWLSQSMILQGIPFPYLVADERLLPLETIRFFQVDPAWVESLVDGAMSIGRQYSDAEGAAPSLVGEQAHGERIKAAARAATPNIRRRLLKKPPVLPLGSSETPYTQKPETPGDASPMITGFLLRSQVIASWKSLDVLGYTQANSPYANPNTPDAVQSTEWLRLERLASNVLIGLFPGTLYELVLHQPPEAIHFGFDSFDPTSNIVTKSTVRVPTTGWDAPDTQYSTAACDISFGVTNRIIDLTSLSQALGSTLSGLSQAPGYYQSQAAPGSDYQDHLVSSDFALEMVQGVGLVSFINAAPAQVSTP